MTIEAIVLFVDEMKYFHDTYLDEFSLPLVSELCDATFFPSHRTRDQEEAEKYLHENGHSFRSVYVRASI